MLMAFQEHYGDPITPGAREKAIELVSGWGEKFAELIVKEFSKQVQIEGRFRLEREQTLIWLCCENAKKHFGVEE